MQDGSRAWWEEADLEPWGNGYWSYLSVGGNEMIVEPGWCGVSGISWLVDPFGEINPCNGPGNVYHFLHYSFLSLSKPKQWVVKKLLNMCTSEEVEALVSVIVLLQVCWTRMDYQGCACQGTWRAPLLTRRQKKDGVNGPSTFPSFKSTSPPLVMLTLRADCSGITQPVYGSPSYAD